jgi:hypothetical protein
VDTALPADVAATVVTVGADCAMPLIEPQLAAIKKVARIPTRQRILACTFTLNVLNAGGNQPDLFITHAL